MKKSIASLVSIVVLLGLFMSACSKPAVPEVQEKVLTFARPEDISTWDPADNNSISGFIVFRCLYDTLIEIADSGEVVPGLATEWSCTPDGLAWTFSLRSGVKFHNGEEFDSESVQVTLERFLNETLLRGTLWTALEGVDTPDALTAVVRLKTPDATLLSTLSNTPMLPPKAFAEKGTNLFTNPIGTGPFKFVEWRKNDRTVLEKFDDYWGKKANVDKLVYLPIVEDSTRVAGLKTGEIDIADTVPVQEVASLEATDGVEVIRMPVWDAIYLGVKLDKPPFDDVRVRKALSLALDREQIVEFIMQGGRPLDILLPEGVLGHDPSFTLEKRDLAKAKQLLAEAGYPNGLTFDFIAPMGWMPKTTELLEAFRGQWAEAGIVANIQVMDGAAFIERRGAGEYNLFLTSGAYTNADPDAILQRVAADGYKLGLPNQELVDAVVESKRLTDRTERDAKLREVVGIFREQYGPFLTVCQTEFIVGMRSNVSGVVLRRDKLTDLRWGAKD